MTLGFWTSSDDMPSVVGCTMSAVGVKRTPTFHPPADARRGFS